MSDVSGLRYLESHEWVLINGETARVGISDHAQREISDVVFVELPEVGKELRQKDPAMVVESVKAAFDIYAPISGKVTKVNTALADSPETVNQSPFEDGWLYEMSVENSAEADALMTQEAYDSFKDKAH